MKNLSEAELAQYSMCVLLKLGDPVPRDQLASGFWIFCLWDGTKWKGTGKSQARGNPRKEAKSSRKRPEKQFPTGKIRWFGAFLDGRHLKKLISVKNRQPESHWKTKPKSEKQWTKKAKRNRTYERRMVSGAWTLIDQSCCEATRVGAFWSGGNFTVQYQMVNFT